MIPFFLRPQLYIRQCDVRTRHVVTAREVHRFNRIRSSYILVADPRQRHGRCLIRAAPFVAVVLVDHDRELHLRDLDVRESYPLYGPHTPLEKLIELINKLNVL